MHREHFEFLSLDARRSVLRDYTADRRVARCVRRCVGARRWFADVIDRDTTRLPESMR